VLKRSRKEKREKGNHCSFLHSWLTIWPEQEFRELHSIFDLTLLRKNMNRAKCLFKFLKLKIVEVVIHNYGVLTATSKRLRLT
jgi:hypothetical protein